MCDFEYGRIEPSLGKVRRVVVVSPRSYNHRFNFGPGRCVVVPFSMTEIGDKPAHIPFGADTYRSLSEPTWALCDCVRSVSHERLNRVRMGGENLNEIMSQADLARIDDGLQRALGLAE